MDNIEVAKLVISICALVVSVLTLCGFGVYMSLHTKKRFEKKETEAEHIELLKKQEEEKKMMELFSKAFDVKFAPITAQLDNIQANLALNTEGTVTILRNDMKKALDFYKERGYATVNDKASWMELYNTYGKLGGNHFKEYVDGWKEEIKNLPTEKKKSRQKLVEKK